MKKCEFCGEQEKCPQYDVRKAMPGFVDLTCIHWRENYLGRDGGDICDAPEPKKVEDEI